LEHRLVEDFPKLKKKALILSLQATSDEMIRLKVAELRSRMWKVAALSATVATIPLPGVSMAFDLGLVVEEADVYYTQLGLDEVSLKRYAKLTSCDYRQLRTVVDSRLGCKVIGVEGMKKLIDELAKRAPSLLASAAVEETARFVQVIGSFLSAITSFVGTYYALRLVLNKMESVAREVVNSAADGATEADRSDED